MCVSHTKSTFGLWCEGGAARCRSRSFQSNSGNELERAFCSRLVSVPLRPPRLVGLPHLRHDRRQANRRAQAYLAEAEPGLRRRDGDGIAAGLGSTSHAARRGARAATSAAVPSPAATEAATAARAAKDPGRLGCAPLHSRAAPSTYDGVTHLSCSCCMALSPCCVAFTFGDALVAAGIPKGRKMGRKICCCGSIAALLCAYEATRSCTSSTSETPLTAPSLPHTQAEEAEDNDPAGAAITMLMACLACFQCAAYESTARSELMKTMVASLLRPL